MFDLIIKNATVIDGTGKEGFAADVAISGGKIAKIAAGLTGSENTIDATGLTLTPGFIDSHSHGDLSIYTNPDHAQAVEQGITFSIGGQCGGSVVPSTESNRFATMAEFAEKMADCATAGNMGLLVGHGTIRIAVMGRENRTPTEAELSQMAKLLQECLDEGAMGMSMGLYYTPGSYATEHELTTLAKVVGKNGGVLVAHIRNESDYLLEAIDEFIGYCRAGGCRGVVSHLKAAEKPNHYKLPLAIERVEKARSEGLDIYADAYPYTASSTSMASRFIPREFIPQGTKTPVALLEDPEVREKIRAWSLEKWNKDLSFVLVTSCTYHPEYVGKNLNEIAHAMGFDDPIDAVFSLLREKGQYCQCCFHSMSEENVAKKLAHPMVMIGTDSNAGNTSKQYHPRRTGTFPRVLGRYVREQRITTLPEMIRKMTSLPASVYSLAAKGRIAQGYDADLCLFDAEAIQDQADYVNCAAPNLGIRYVIIGGRIVLEKGSYNGTRAGRLYLRKK